MTNRFLVYTGTISYGLYLLHKFPFDIAKDLHLDHPAIVLMPVLLGGSYLMAIVSWKLLESPFLRLKRFFESKRAGDVNLPDPEVMLARLEVTEISRW